MNEPNFEPAAGVLVRNKKGQAILWTRGKDPVGGQPFCMFRTWPERADADAKPKLVEAVEMIKATARKMGMPAYDFAEIEAQLRTFFKELGPEKFAPHPKQDDIEVSVHDVITGEIHRMTIGLSKGDFKRGGS